MTALSNNLKAALNKLKGIVGLQWAGSLFLLLFAALWLQIPDSHVWEFALSILLGLLIVLAVVWLCARTVRSLRGDNAPFAYRIVILLIFAAVWMLLLYPIGWGRAKEELYAGFVNSKLSPSLRYFFTYNRLLALQEYFYDLLQSIAAGLLIPLIIEATAFGINRDMFRRAGHAWRSGLYWLVVILSGFAGAALTRALLGWTPGRGLSLEMISLLVRVGFAYTVDIFLWCFVLSLAAVCLERGKANRSVE
jgi:hypothetical protein